MNHYIGRNTITLGRCGSEMCTTHLVQKMLIRETNIKIVSEFMKFVNLLKNMGEKNSTWECLYNSGVQHHICGRQLTLQMSSHSKFEKLQKTYRNSSG